MRKILMFCTGLVLFIHMHGTIYGAIEDSCQLTHIVENNSETDLGPAIIFGDIVVVPAFQIQFVDEKSFQSIVPSRVTLCYKWKWLEYPYPEHPWGVWSDANDCVKCSKLSTEISVPEFTVRPRGWYNGKYTKFPFTIPFSKKPAFTGIIIGFDIDNNRSANTYAEISVKEAMKLKNKTVVVKVKPYSKCDIVIK